jgi:rhomboid protease GluP
MDKENYDEPEQEQEQQPKNKSPFHALIPKGDYFFTPILLNINILVFVVMVISGVNWLAPDPQALINWGANYRPYTANGQAWRLFTSMFVHVGILHLGVNMYSLYSLGRLLESFIGRWRFIALYLFTGLCGSAVSLWWHAAAPSAGASGAIFGLFGVFAAIVTTNLIKPTIRKQLLRGIGITILINAAISLWAAIDTSAHLGGFLSGLLGGYLIYFDLKAFYHRRINQYKGLIISIILICSVIILFWKMSPATPDINVLMARYDQEERHSLDFFDKKFDSATVEEIEKNLLQPWEHNQAIVDTIIASGISKEQEKSFHGLQIYTALRLKAAKEIYRSKKENRKDLMDSANATTKAANKIVVNPIDE